MSFKNIGRYGTVGFELLVFMGAGFWLGHWLDGRYGNGNGLITLGGFALGAAAGFRQLFRAAKLAQRDIADDERRERTGEMEYQDEYLEIARKPDDEPSDATPSFTASNPKNES